MKTTDNRRLELKLELVRRDMRHRELAASLRDRGFEVETSDIDRLMIGRWDPSAEIKQAIAEIFTRPSFELFQ